jgi:phage shock protein A
VVNDRLDMVQAEVKMLRANVERVEDKMDNLAADIRELKTLVQKQSSGKRSSTVCTAAAIRVRAADPDPHPGYQKMENFVGLTVSSE